MKINPTDSLKQSLRRVQLFSCVLNEEISLFMNKSYFKKARIARNRMDRNQSDKMKKYQKTVRSLIIMIDKNKKF